MDPPPAAMKSTARCHREVRRRATSIAIIAARGPLARRAAVVDDCWLMIFPPRSNYCRHAGEEGVLFEKTTTATKTNGIN